jgi:choline-sulfatase
MTQKYPNILFILSDDQGAWAMGCAGNDEIETPNLDRLAATGMRFENFFCASPVCSPARATLLTGRIPSQHGIHDWLAAGNTTADYEPERDGELIEYLAGQPGYTDYLAAAGYDCAISGKWHLGDSHHAQKGLDFWTVHAKGGGPYYNAPMVRDGDVYEEPGYVTDVFTDNALRWLEARESDARPFYLSVHYTAPHSPWTRENHPSDLYDRYYDDCLFDSVPDGLTPPEWVQYRSIPVADAEERRIFLSGYYAAVTAMDRNIGRLIDWLDANDLREETLIIFTSDNGMNMGHHGVYGKGNATYPLNMFDESIKVPFIVSHPGHIEQGTVNQDLVSQYDFLPTLLDTIGIENPQASSLPGKSFANAFHRSEEAGNDHIIVYDEYGPVRMIRNAEWKYVHRSSFGPNELYYLRNDPAEQRNLAGDPDHEDVEDELRSQLTEWFARYVDPKVDGANEVVTGSGQLGLCGQYADRREAFSESRVEDLLTVGNDPVHKPSTE